MTSYLDPAPLGTCQVFNNLNGAENPPVATASNLDAGANFSVSGPNGSQAFAATPGTTVATLSSSASYLSPGQYTITGNGGADVHAINVSTSVPPLPTLTSPTAGQKITRSGGMTVTWTPAGSDGAVQVQVGSATDGTFTTGAVASCLVAPGAGSLTIPPFILQALPVGSNAFVTFGNITDAPFTATGLDVGQVETQNDGITVLITLQ